MVVLGLLAALLIAALVAWRQRPRSLWTGFFLTAFTLGPMATMAVGSVLGSLWGCTVNEAGGNACLVAGRDMGPLLTELFVSAWYTMLTLPLGGGLLLIWLVLRLRPSGLGRRARTARAS
ncbi:MAG: hypothetical protein HKN04_05425 [Rhodothermaceae bacterium]|nr:hypothetical protein [Rhodothermaceae bacterium]